MQKLIILLLIILLFPVFSQAQKWKRSRVEYSFGIGATNFLGDLGGRDKVGNDFVLDFEYKATRFGAGIGYRYQLAKRFYVKGNFYYALVSGDDDLTEEFYRSRRQLNFKAHILELSGQLEYMLIKQESGHLYRLRGVRGKRWFKFEVYLLGGIGGIWFSPQGERNGKWHSLRPLHTEGQGLPGGPSQYNGFSVVVPYGIGFRRMLDGGARTRHFGAWSISLELTMRKTFTDYIDDVSTFYYNDGGSDAIEAAYGEQAGFFHDPSGVHKTAGYASPEQRGDHTDNDAYMMGIISINYKPSRRKGRRRHLPKF
jgi:hypothetical protein